MPDKSYSLSELSEASGIAPSELSLRIARGEIDTYRDDTGHWVVSHKEFLRTTQQPRRQSDGTPTEPENLAHIDAEIIELRHQLEDTRREANQLEGHLRRIQESVTLLEQLMNTKIQLRAHLSDADVCRTGESAMRTLR